MTEIVYTESVTKESENYIKSRQDRVIDSFVLALAKKVKRNIDSVEDYRKALCEVIDLKYDEKFFTALKSSVEALNKKVTEVVTADIKAVDMSAVSEADKIDLKLIDDAVAQSYSFDAIKSALMTKKLYKVEQVDRLFNLRLSLKSATAEIKSLF